MISPETHAFFFLHGWGGSDKSNDIYMKDLTKIGYSCASFDLLGHGESTEDKNEISRMEFLDHTILNFDEAALLKDKKVILVGSSFGSYLGILLSERRKVETLILRAPANYPDENFDLPNFRFSGNETKIADWRSQKLEKSETASLRALSHFEGRVLIVESECDEMVPRATIENYCQAVQHKENLTHVVMKGTSHRLKNEGEKKLFLALFYKWLLL